MYANLENELEKAKITKWKLAKTMHMSDVALSNKLHSRSQFKLHEMLTIQKILNEKANKYMSLDYLFKELQ